MKYIYFSLKNGSFSLFEFTVFAFEIWRWFAILRNCYVESQKKKKNNNDEIIIIQNDHWIEVNYVKFIPQHEQSYSVWTEFNERREEDKEIIADESFSDSAQSVQYSTFN